MIGFFVQIASYKSFRMFSFELSPNLSECLLGSVLEETLYLSWPVNGIIVL